MRACSESIASLGCPVYPVPAACVAGLVIEVACCSVVAGVDSGCSGMLMLLHGQAGVGLASLDCCMVWLVWA